MALNSENTGTPVTPMPEGSDELSSSLAKTVYPGSGEMSLKIRRLRVGVQLHMCCAYFSVPFQKVLINTLAL